MKRPLFGNRSTKKGLRPTRKDRVDPFYIPLMNFNFVSLGEEQLQNFDVGWTNSLRAWDEELLSILLYSSDWRPRKVGVWMIACLQKFEYEQLLKEMLDREKTLEHLAMALVLLGQPRHLAWLTGHLNCWYHGRTELEALSVHRKLTIAMAYLFTSNQLEIDLGSVGILDEDLDCARQAYEHAKNNWLKV